MHSKYGAVAYRGKAAAAIRGQRWIATSILILDRLDKRAAVYAYTIQIRVTDINLA